MTDQQIYNNQFGDTLVRIDRWEHAEQSLNLHLPCLSETQGVIIPTARLLAMIDTIDPDAVRAYLRERSDLIDGPGELLTVNGANMTAKQAVYADVPEADSTEDVDEQPDRDDPTESAQIDRAWALDKAKSALPSRDRLAVTPLLNVADWIMTGTRGDQ